LQVLDAAGGGRVFRIVAHMHHLRTDSNIFKMTNEDYRVV